jgi:hypothetical protein
MRSDQSLPRNWKDRDEETICSSTTSPGTSATSAWGFDIDSACNEGLRSGSKYKLNVLLCDGGPEGQQRT